MHATKPVQVVRRGQRVAGEGGGPEGGEGPSGAGEGGAMAATARRMLVRTGSTYQTIALTDDQADVLGLAEPAPLSAVERIARRNPDLLSLASDSYSPGVTPHVNRHFDFDVHETGARDDGDPSDPDGADTDANIRRYLAMAKNLLSSEKPHGSVNRTGR